MQCGILRNKKEQTANIHKIKHESQRIKLRSQTKRVYNIYYMICMTI